MAPSAWDAALRLLGTRARSAAEMRQRLAGRGFEADEVDSVLERLETAGLIDDVEFAGEWVTSRHRNSNRGRLALRRELRTKGIDPEVAEAALAEIDPADERQQAAEFARRRLRVDPAELAADRELRAKTYRRLAGALGRRGYPPAIINDVLGELLSVDAGID